jgi:hypothetical protein
MIVKPHHTGAVGATSQLDRYLFSEFAPYTTPKIEEPMDGMEQFK